MTHQHNKSWEKVPCAFTFLPRDRWRMWCVAYLQRWVFWIQARGKKVNAHEQYLIYLPLFFIVLRICNTGSYRVNSKRTWPFDKSIATDIKFRCWLSRFRRKFVFSRPVLVLLWYQPLVLRPPGRDWGLALRLLATPQRRAPQNVAPSLAPLIQQDQAGHLGDGPRLLSAREGTTALQHGAPSTGHHGFIRLRFPYR